MGTLTKGFGVAEPETNVLMKLILFRRNKSHNARFENLLQQSIYTYSVSCTKHHTSRQKTITNCITNNCEEMKTDTSVKKNNEIAGRRTV